MLRRCCFVNRKREKHRQRHEADAHWLRFADAPMTSHASNRKDELYAMSEQGGSLQSVKAVPNRAFQSILDGVPGAWFFARSDGTLAYVNGGACVGLGYSRDELLRCTVFDFDPVMTHELWTMLWATTLPTESKTIRTRHRRKDGTEFPVEVRTTRILLDSEDLAISYTVDLTANEQTELINRHLLAAIEQASDAVVMTDALHDNPIVVLARQAGDPRRRGWV